LRRKVEIWETRIKETQRNCASEENYGMRIGYGVALSGFMVA
jgi:hypothetical protein